ncbi:hypothetical protein MYCOZU2_06094 (plasmid) [Mycobacterium intracellulare subsp. chimaera]|uniref:Uncharacterized protein n=1 Tax=Mycobacterium intracellulare subsp. chimaera TaxID=222805 RepID=A0A7U5MRR9_MYCIT|nr:hypothetical protein MYCOZU2_06094 [Mycobacterium intracellulare subsp. chimaera]
MPMKKSAKCPTGPLAVYVAVAGAPPSSKVNRDGMKLIPTLFVLFLKLLSPSTS